jgi:hypothetical protein
MALGELLYEETGKQTSARAIIETEDPTAEVTGIGSMKLKDVNFMTQWTTLVRIRNNGMSHTEGKGSIYKDN